MKNENFFLKKSVIATIGILALIGGFVFFNEGGQVNIAGQVTGNSILNSFSSFSLISLIGLLLILCSSILIIYSIVKK